MYTGGDRCTCLYAWTHSVLHHMCTSLHSYRQTSKLAPGATRSDGPLRLREKKVVINGFFFS
jgi:hypothetical protein